MLPVSGAPRGSRSCENHSIHGIGNEVTPTPSGLRRLVKALAAPEVQRSKHLVNLKRFLHFVDVNSGETPRNQNTLEDVGRT